MELDAALDRPPTGERPRFDTTAGALVGSRCRECRAAAWPGRAVCHRCGSAHVGEEVFVGVAQLVSYTEVMVPRTDIEAPYVLGQVRLRDGPVVFGRVVGLVEPVVLPCPVHTRVDLVRSGAESYWFEPEEAADGRVGH